MATDPRDEPELPPLPRVIRVALSSVFPFHFGVAGYLTLKGDGLVGVPMLAIAVLSFSAMLSAIVLFLLDPDARAAYAERRAVRKARARAAAARAADWARAAAARDAARAAEAEKRRRGEELYIEAETGPDVSIEIDRCDEEAAAGSRKSTVAMKAPKERRKPPPKCIRTKVVGVTFRNDDGTDRQRLIARHCRDGGTLTIRRDLDNRHDEFAVAVFAGRRQIGHLRSELAQEVAGWLEVGMKALVTILQVTGGGRGENFGVNIQIDMT